MGNRRALNEVFLKKVFFFKIDLATNFQKMPSSYKNLRNGFNNYFVFFTNYYYLEILLIIQRYIARRALLIFFLKIDNIWKYNDFHFSQKVFLFQFKPLRLAK